jgi:hypothetical protein
VSDQRFFRQRQNFTNKPQYNKVGGGNPYDGKWRADSRVKDVRRNKYPKVKTPVFSCLR